jgi:tetratricopeptide (TPR) repeat protein
VKKSTHLSKIFFLLTLIVALTVPCSLATEPLEETDSMDAEAYFNRGMNNYKNGEHDRAILDFTKAIELDPTFARAYFWRGNVYFLIREEDKAISDYNKALEINPKLAGAYYEKAFACELTGRRKEAIETYEGFIKYARPDDTYRIKDARGRIWKLKWGCFVWPLIFLIAGVLCLWYSYHKKKIRSKNEKSNLDKRNRGQA